MPDRYDKQHVRYEIRVLEFQRCILSNGHLEVWEPESETMLGRSETCIPVNYFVKNEFYESELEKLNVLLGEWSDDACWLHLELANVNLVVFSEVVILVTEIVVVSS